MGISSAASSTSKPIPPSSTRRVSRGPFSRPGNGVDDVVGRDVEDETVAEDGNDRGNAEVDDDDDDPNSTSSFFFGKNLVNKEHYEKKM